MSQATLTTPSSPLTMTALKTFLDNALGALVTVQRGDPAGISSPIEGMLCWDTTGATDILKRYTVAAGWVELFSCNITTGAVVPYKNGSEVTDSVPTGTKMWFYQNTAPTGWTIDATPADAVLAVKGGSQAFNANGGTKAGTWTQPNHTHTGPSHTHTGPSHTHAGGTLAIPNHYHLMKIGGRTDSQGVLGRSGDDNDGSTFTSTYTTSQGGGGTTHYKMRTESVPSATALSGSTAAGGTGATGAEGTGATGGSATANTWRPLAQLGIICTKD